MATESIFIGIDDERIELTGKDLTDFLADQNDQLEQIAAQEAELQARTKARASALAKLKKLGLTAAEIEAL
jgi:hypothetical protein